LRGRGGPWRRGRSHKPEEEGRNNTDEDARGWRNRRAKPTLGPCRKYNGKNNQKNRKERVAAQNVFFAEKREERRKKASGQVGTPRPYEWGCTSGRPNDIADSLLREKGGGKHQRRWGFEWGGKTP